jgi:hypothetical protein
MKRQSRVDLSEHDLEPVDQFAVPGQKFRAAMNVRGLMYLILFEPEAHASGRSVGSAASKKAVV